MRKVLVTILITVFLLTNISSVFAQVSPTDIPTPTPTYAPFVDQSSGITTTDVINAPEHLINTIQRSLFSSGLDCGSIGKVCCGKVVVPQLEAIANFISGSILGALPGNFFGRTLAFLPSLVIGLVSPVGEFVANLPQRFLGFETETRGYCAQGYPSNPFNLEQCSCVSSNNISAARLCEVLTNNSEQNECFNNCMSNGRGVWTALGCFSSDLSTLIKEKVFGLGIQLAFLVALMCIIYSAIQLQISQGSAEKIKKAQELLTSCIMGLMLIIFSVFILQLIGVSILKIPGFK